MERPSWHKAASCRSSDPAAFFPAPGSSQRQAKQICADCGVRDVCLDHALTAPERYGIWGGLSERQRSRVLAARRRQVTAVGAA
jgi:WhiB family redox-sensing transcriptional regulator